MNGTVNGLKVRTGIKAGKISANHSRAGLKVKAGIKAGKISANHARTALA